MKTTTLLSLLFLTGCNSFLIPADADTIDALRNNAGGPTGCGQGSHFQVQLFDDTFFWSVCDTNAGNRKLSDFELSEFRNLLGDIETSLSPDCLADLPMLSLVASGGARTTRLQNSQTDCSGSPISGTFVTGLEPLFVWLDEHAR